MSLDTLCVFEHCSLNIICLTDSHARLAIYMHILFNNFHTHNLSERASPSWDVVLLRCVADSILNRRNVPSIFILASQRETESEQRGTSDRSARESAGCVRVYAH